ncbi:MAG: lipid-A-disaccharide synthase N-terminal domain-containing protein [Planctomycetes bacterium]|nr:lipid-A-disaccharide synthase N-terminal domain-containing protein [Planctomycetota bacterium]
MQTLLNSDLLNPRNVFSAIGISGQVLFTARIVVQWYASEKAKQSVVPKSFWWLSVIGTLMLLVYAWFTRDPVFLIGPSLNLFLYVRNLMIAGKGRRFGSIAILAPLALVMLISGGVAAYLTAEEKNIITVDASPFWLVIGFTGTALWTLRFPVQWIISERVGKSVLPPSFWWMSIFGAALLTAYAAYKPDVVFVFAYVLNPIPAIRNLMLLYRKPKPSEGGADILVRGRDEGATTVEADTDKNVRATESADG